MTLRREYQILGYFQQLEHKLRVAPMLLGGYTGASGGYGGPPGGYIGYLPQSRVTFDTTEAATTGYPTPSGASLVHNLNRIRYRLVQLENESLIVQEDGSPVATGVSVINFTGSVSVSQITGGVTVTVTASGATGSGIAGIEIQDEGGTVDSQATTLDFQGGGVTATLGSGKVIITIPSGGTPGSGIAGIEVQDEGVTVSSQATVLDFQGNSVTAIESGGKVIVTISGLSGSGGGLREIIYQKTLTTSSGGFNNITIPSGYDHIELDLFGRSNDNADADTILLHLNNDTTASNYKDNHYYFGDADGNTYTNSPWFGSVPGATGGADHFSYCWAKLEKPDVANKYRGWTAQARNYRDTSKYYNSVGGVTWLAKEAITEIDITPTNGDFVAGSSLRVVGVKNTGGGSSTQNSQALFSIKGTLITESGVIPIPNVMGRSLTISKVYLRVAEPPTGSAIIADINKDGSTIFTNQANRPQIAAGAYTGQTTSIDVPTWADGSYLTMDIDQVGSSTAGSTITAVVVYS